MSDANASFGEIGPYDGMPMSSCCVANTSWLSLAASPSDARTLASGLSADNDTLWHIASTNAKLDQLDNERERECQEVFQEGKLADTCFSRAMHRVTIDEACQQQLYPSSFILTNDFSRTRMCRDADV